MNSRTTSSTGGSAVTQALGHDQAGRLNVLTGNGVNLAWTYDQNGNLLQARNKVSGATSTYSYAGSGTTQNELTSLATMNGPTLTYDYDSAGDTTAITSTAALTPTSLSYDAENRLRSVALPNGAVVKQSQRILSHDQAGRLNALAGNEVNLSWNHGYNSSQLQAMNIVSGMCRGSAVMLLYLRADARGHGRLETESQKGDRCWRPRPSCRQSLPVSSTRRRYRTCTSGSRKPLRAAARIMRSFSSTTAAPIIATRC
jgi:YD repeat-containing protein